MRLFRSLTSLTNLALVLTIAGVMTLPMTESAHAQAQKDATEWIRHGRQLWQNNNISGAIAAYQQAANLEPRNSRIFTSLGFLLTQQNNYSGASRL